MAEVDEGPESQPESQPDRRSDETIRQQVRDLLELIRDFYGTCHMVAVGQLEPSKAKSKAKTVETKLQVMMADMLERVEAAAEDEAAND